MNKYYIMKIKELLNIIEKEYIPILVIDINIIKLINIIDALYKKIPHNIKNYTHILLPIKTNIKCMHCQRNGEYKILNMDKEIYCWRHSQII